LPTLDGLGDRITERIVAMALEQHEQLFYAATSELGLAVGDLGEQRQR
jgi:hypothetical protein